MTSTADAVAVATLVLAGDAERLEAAATLDGARHGPVLDQMPTMWSAVHQTRIDAARDRAASMLGADAYGSARERGAAMTYDEIIAYTLEQLTSMADV